MAHWRAAVLAALICLGHVSLAFAQDIVLRSRDGSIELTGTLLGYNGEFYRIQTEYGALTVDGSGVLCDGVGCPSLTDYVADVTISGSATIGRVLMPALIQAFASRNALIVTRDDQDDTRFVYTLENTATGKTVGRFRFHIANTDQGFRDLLSDDADVVMALREIRDEEAKLAKDAALGDLTKANRSRVLALDAMVPVVSLSNPVDSITLAQLSRLLAGQIQNWNQLGGPDAPITLHLRDAESGLAQGLQDRLLRPINEPLGGEIQRHSDNVALAQAVSRDVLGLGVASFSEIGKTKPLALTGACGFTLQAARRTIKTEDYPLTAPMFIYIPARRLPALTREFLAFTNSPDAQIVIRRAGFVDQAPEEVALDLQGDRLANAILVADSESTQAELLRMTRRLIGQQRLTTSFRFEAGSARLDAQSRSNVLQLARDLEAGQYDGRQMIFVGFSDGQGPAPANLGIAQKRAETVRAAVQDAAETADLTQVDILTDAFGEAMPMACDDSQWGRQVNRRVEVWVK